MALLSATEQLMCTQQGVWGATLRCDNPKCDLVITQPIIWSGHKHRIYHSRECKEAVEGSNYSKYIKTQHRQGHAGASGVVPTMGADIDRIEQEIMKQVIANPHSRWNKSSCLRLFKGTDRDAVRTAVDNLLADKSLYQVGRTMSILPATEFKAEVKARKQEERLEIREKKQRKRKRLKMKLRREKKAARIARRAEKAAQREAAKYGKKKTP